MAMDMVDIVAIRVKLLLRCQTRHGEETPLRPPIITLPTQEPTRCAPLQLPPARGAARGAAGVLLHLGPCQVGSQHSINHPVPVNTYPVGKMD